MISRYTQCCAQSLSGKVSPVANGNKYRDPQSNNRQKVRDTESFSYKEDASFKPFPAGLRESCERQCRQKIIGSWEMDDTKRTRPAK